MTPPSHPHPHPRPATSLGPRQIKWLRENIPAFDEAWTSVKKSDEHAQRIREKLAGAQ